MNLIKSNELTMSSREIDNAPIIKGIGYVYIIENTKTKSIKIGCSTKPKERIKTVINSSNSNGRIFISHKIKGMFKLENTIHRIFTDRRDRGEWFFVGFEEAKEALIKNSPKEITMEEINRLLILKDKNARRILNFTTTKIKESNRSNLVNQDYYSLAANSLDTALMMLSVSGKAIRSTCEKDAYLGLIRTSEAITDLTLRIIDIQREIKKIEAIQANEFSSLSKEEKEFVNQQLNDEAKKIRAKASELMVA